MLHMRGPQARSRMDIVTAHLRVRIIDVTGTPGGA